MAELGNDGNGKIDIPLLKKESKERKGGGFLFSGAQGAGGAGVGGVGAGKAAGGLMALLGSKAGAAAIVLALGGAGLVGYGALKGQPREKSVSPSLSPLESSIQVRKRSADGSRSLKFASESAGGSIQWDPSNPGGAQGQTASKDAAAADPEQAGTPEQDALQDGQGQVADGKPRLNRGDFGQLSQSLSGGGGSGGASGGQSIFGNNGAFKPKQMQGNMGGNSLMARGPAGGARGGKLSAYGGKQNTRAAQKMTSKGIGAKRAMGQLKFASRQSSQATAAGSTEGGASYAAAAFEQGKVTGGQLDGAGGAGLGDMAPVMGGGPDGVGAGNNPTSTCPEGWTMMDGGGCQPPDTAGTNVTPYQGAVDSAQQMTTTALILAVIGLALLALGYALVDSANPITAFIGACLIVIGLILVAVAIVMAVMAMTMGDSISSGYGQQEQGNVIDQHATSAKDGEQSSYKGQLGESKDIGQSTEEEKNATYEEPR